jgi:mitogen-activated protein kinase 1/3
MLQFDPNKRVDVEGALSHRYFEGLHAPDDEPVAKSKVDWSFDNFKPTKRSLQNYVYVECAKFHPDILPRDKDTFVERSAQQLLL